MTTRILAVDAPTTRPALEISAAASNALKAHGWNPPPAQPHPELVTHHQIELTILQRLAARLEPLGETTDPDISKVIVQAAGDAAEAILDLIGASR